MTRAMLHNKDMAKDLWGEVVNTAFHIVNRVHFKPSTKKTPYELWKGRKPNVKYFRIFGSICFILKDRENVGKFDTQSDEGIFLGYSFASKAYRVLNKRSRKVMETIDVVIDKALTSKSLKVAEQMPKSILPLPLETDQEVGDQDPFPLVSPSAIQVPEDPSTSPQLGDHLEKEPSSRIKLSHPPDMIMVNMNELTLRKHTVDKYVANFVSYSCYLSQVEPAKVEDALQDESWVETMYDELHQFQRSDVWTLVSRPEGDDGCSLYPSTLVYICPFFLL